VDLPHAALLDNEIYRVEIWDFELIGADDFCGTFLFNTNQDDQTITVGPVTIQISIEDAETQYSHSVDVEIVQPFITAQGDQLTANAPLSTSPTQNHFTWFLDGVEIPGSDTISITAIGSGIYTVMVDVSGRCEGLSEPFNYMVTATEETASDDAIRLYPNPFREVVYIDLKGKQYQEEFKIIIMDIHGRKISPKTIWNGDQLLVYTSDLANGIYFLQLYQQGLETKTQTLIKQ
jgi:hypothetical protein